MTSQSRTGLSGGTALLTGLVAFLCYWLFFPVLMLVWRSLTDDSGNYTGLASFLAMFRTPGLRGAVWHTLSMGALVTVAVVLLAFVTAYGLARARIFGSRAATALCLLPLFAPSLFPSVGLVYFFGNQGVLKWMLGGTLLYGPVGIFLGSVIFCLPHAVILCTTALRSIDSTLYEAADTLNAGGLRQFLTITLPHARYGLLSAALVVFILTVTDFGVPKVLGGDYSMLATEIYKQVIGMQNFSLGASVSLVLMLPSVCAFFADSWARKKQALLFSRGVFQPVAPHGGRDCVFTVVVWAILGMQIAVFGIVVWGSFVSFWPYDLSLTLTNYDFSSIGGSLAPFANSLLIALYAAVLGPAIMFLGAYSVGRCPQPLLLSCFYRVLALLPLSIPGTVLGLAYIFAFNRPGGWYAFLYGSMPLLVLNTAIHFYTVGHLAFAASLQSINPDYEAVGFTAGVGRHVTFFQVILPLSGRSLLEVSMYIFVNALTTISALVFLYTPDILPASVFMLQVNDTGNTAAAAAVGTGLLAMALGARMVYALLQRLYDSQTLRQ